MKTQDESWKRDHTAPEQLLWSAVLETALSDALSHRDPEERKRATRWFREGGQHFKMVCDMANYDPDFVQRKVMLLLEASSEKTRQPDTLN